jgi:hypothetical protein
MKGLVADNSVQFISHATDPIQGHQEHVGMEIVR